MLLLGRHHGLMLFDLDELTGWAAAESLRGQKLLPKLLGWKYSRSVGLRAYTKEKDYLRKYQLILVLTAGYAVGIQVLLYLHVGMI